MNDFLVIFYYETPYGLAKFDLNVRAIKRLHQWNKSTFIVHDKENHPWYRANVTISDFFDIQVITSTAVYHMDTFGRLIDHYGRCW